MLFFRRSSPARRLSGNHEIQNEATPCPQRRRLLKGMAGAATLVTALPEVAGAVTTALPANARDLAFKHTHTGEQLSLVYRIGDQYLPDGLLRVAQLMRDFRNGEMHPIDPALLDVLWQTRQNLRSNAAFEIVSAYRSPQTNDMLRNSSPRSGVAKHSMHLTGQAVDIHLPGVALADVRDAALELKRGGVGYYADSGFVHLDTGRVRHW